MVDGKIMFKKPIGGLEDLMLNNRKAGDGRAQIADRFDEIPLQIQAGVREMVVGFIERSRLNRQQLLVAADSAAALPNFGNIEIIGPYKIDRRFNSQSSR